MHAAIVQLTPVLGAEKSKVPFYIAGGLLVAWALIVSLGLGARIPSFPRTVAVERTVIAVSVVLVLGAVSTAVATSGGSTGKLTVTPVTPVAKESHEAASGSATTSLKEEANPEGQLRFSTKNLSALAGRVTISFTNMSPLMHNMTIAQGTTVLGATPTFQGATKTLTLNLKPGTYVFYCSVPGHRAAGMEGKLTVQ